MKKYSSNKRRSDSSAKFFVAALCVVLGWFAASSIPSGATLGETWRFRLDSFGPFAANAQRRADERPRSYLDASGRRVDSEETTAPRVETDSAFAVEATELWANEALPFEAEPVGATFAEAEQEAKLEPVSFANDEEESDSLFANDGWLVVDENALERDQWSRDLRLEPFPEQTFAEFSAPTWRDDVAVAPATLDELRALEFEPGVVASSLVSSSLRRRTANAQLSSGDYSFAETSNASDANAPQTSSVSAQTATQTSTVAPTRVGAFTACETFDSNGVAKVIVQ
ncbi:MAG: hypothetical protein IJO40_14160 [Thermoguttaceae bacterium]|nr:hypothetical protein [Thermoguttaceae bacterium]